MPDLGDLQPPSPAGPVRPFDPKDQRRRQPRRQPRPPPQDKPAGTPNDGDGSSRDHIDEYADPRQF